MLKKRLETLLQPLNRLLLPTLDVHVAFQLAHRASLQTPERLPFRLGEPSVILDAADPSPVRAQRQGLALQAGRPLRRASFTAALAGIRAATRPLLLSIS